MPVSSKQRAQPERSKFFQRQLPSKVHGSLGRDLDLKLHGGSVPVGWGWELRDRKPKQVQPVGSGSEDLSPGRMEESNHL